MSMRPIFAVWGITCLATFALEPPTCHAQVAHAPSIVPGKLTIEVSPNGSSSLDLEPQSLELALCGYLGGGDPESGGSEECRIVFGAGGRLAGPGGLPAPALELLVLSATPGAGGTTAVAVKPLSFKVGYPETYATVCDDFSYELLLATGVQPISLLTLLPPANLGAPTALLVGTLQIAAVASFTPVLGIEVVHSQAVPLSLDLGGRWSVVSASNPAYASLLVQGETNLSLFVDKGPTGWSPRPACGQGKKQCSRFCLEASSQRVGILDGGSVDDVDPGN